MIYLRWRDIKHQSTTKAVIFSSSSRIQNFQKNEMNTRNLSISTWPVLHSRFMIFCQDYLISIWQHCTVTQIWSLSLDLEDNLTCPWSRNSSPWRDPSSLFASTCCNSTSLAIGNCSPLCWSALVAIAVIDTGTFIQYCNWWQFIQKHKSNEILIGMNEIGVNDDSERSMRWNNKAWSIPEKSVLW